MSSGERTVGGAELKIITTPTGLYRIIADGPGANPKLSEGLFTTLNKAKEAIRRYKDANKSIIRKKEIMTAGIERRKAALELANGELNKTVNGK